MKKSDRIRIYLIHHLPLDLPRTSVLEPIDAGRRDGDHIADRQDFAELRAQYWVIHNEELPEYVGFFHFRRYLLPTDRPGKRPYRIQKQPIAGQFAEERWSRILSDAELVVPIPEYTGLTVRERYAIYPNQDVADLDAAVEILCRLHPEYRAAAAQYLSGKSEYYGNIYLMRKGLFRAYWEWLFPLLTEFRERRPDAKPRTEGYLAERLFGIWLTGQAAEGRKIKQLPRVHFTCYDDETHKTSFSSRLRNFLLPPGSRIKGLIARIRFGKRARVALQDAVRHS